MTTYTDENGYTSTSFGDQAAKAAHRAEVEALRRHAWGEAKRVYSETFRMLARERGGINAKNREAIEAEAKMAGRQVAEAIYLHHGYTHCPGQGITAGSCQRLVSPGYTVCPFCDVRF